MKRWTPKAIVIGGSAGSFQVINYILTELPEDFSLPLILCLHRLKNVREGFVEALSIKSNIPVIEPYDKQRIKPGVAYLAPANYHMYVDVKHTFSLSTEEMVHFSRPSIDLTLQSAGYTYHRKLIGIILSGANKDGAWGLKKIKDYGGTTIIQDPNTATVPTMPDAAKSITKVDHVLSPEEIIQYLLKVDLEVKSIKGLSKKTSPS